MKPHTYNQNWILARLRFERLLFTFTTPDWLKFKLGLNSFVGPLVWPRERLLAGEGKKEHPLPVLRGDERGGKGSHACVWLQSQSLIAGGSSLLLFPALPQDPRREVVRIMKYLDLSLSDKVIDEIVELTTFKKMKDNPMANYSCIPKPIFDSSISNFMRKGVNYCKPAVCDVWQKIFEKIISYLYIFTLENVLNDSLIKLLMTLISKYFIANWPNSLSSS